MRKVISGIDINEKKEILLTKKKDTWILPWGKPDGDEDDIACLQREYREELNGAEIWAMMYYKNFEWIAPHKWDMLFIKTYFTKIISDILEPSWEIIAAERVNKKNIHKYVLSDSTQKIVQNLIQDNYL